MIGPLLRRLGRPVALPSATLVVAERDLARLREHLLQPDGMERAAFALLGRRRGAHPPEFLLHRLLLPEDEDYLRQDGAGVQPTGQYVLETLDRLAGSPAVGYLHAHSHPFAAFASFSAIDDRYLPGELATIREFLQLHGAGREVIYLRLVWGAKDEGFTAEAYGLDGASLARIDRMRVVGPGGIRLIASAPAGARRPEEARREALPLARLDRNLRWLGLEGQRRLRETHLVLCGAGGIGSAGVAAARGLGVRRLTLIDPDRVEPSNLNRLFGAGLRDVGRHKVAVLKRNVLAVDPGAEVVTVAASVATPEAQRRAER